MKSHLSRFHWQPWDDDEIAEQARRSWRDYGCLVVNLRDPRLTWPERELVSQLGEKLNGCKAKEPT